MTKRKANFCPYCGTGVEPRTLEGRERTFCPTCEAFVWQNPVPVARAVILDEDEVLFVKRGNEPDRGAWTIPGGVLEVDESAAVGAARELEEETNLRADPADLELVRTGFKMDDQADGSILSICFAIERDQTRGSPRAGTEPDAVRFWNPSRLQASDSERTRTVDRRCLEVARDRLRGGMESD